MKLTKIKIGIIIFCIKSLVLGEKRGRRNDFTRTGLAKSSWQRQNFTFFSFKYIFFLVDKKWKNGQVFHLWLRLKVGGWRSGGWDLAIRWAELVDFSIVRPNGAVQRRHPSLVDGQGQHRGLHHDRFQRR